MLSDQQHCYLRPDLTLTAFLVLVSTGPRDTEIDGAKRDRGVGLHGLRTPDREVSSLVLVLSLGLKGTVSRDRSGFFK